MSASAVAHGSVGVKVTRVTRVGWCRWDGEQSPVNIHEYQAKNLLRNLGVAVPGGGVAYTTDEALDVAHGLSGPVWVVKSQIHAGGRGAGRFKTDPDGKGAVPLAKSKAELNQHLAAMLGNVLITNQTRSHVTEVISFYVQLRFLLSLH